MAALLLVFAVMNCNVYRSLHVYFASGAADFKIYMTAAHMVHDGHAAQLYDLGAQRFTQQSLYPVFLVGDDPLPYNHPAAEALLFLPLVTMATDDAYYLFLVLNVVMLFAALQIARRAMPSWDTSIKLPLMLFAAAFYPAVMCLFLGQDSILLLLLYALCFHAIRRRHLFLAGLALGSGCFKPHLVLPFALMFFVCRRRWNAAYGFLAGAMFVVATSLWLCGWEGLRGFLQLNVETQRYRTWLFNPHLMADLRGLLQSALAARLDFPLLLLLIILVSVIFTVWCCMQLVRMQVSGQTNASGAPLNLEFSFCVISTVLLAYHVYPYDLTLLIIPLLFLIEDCIATSAAGRLWISAGAILFFILPLQTLANSNQFYFLFGLDLLFLAIMLPRRITDKNNDSNQAVFSTSTRQA